jgi:hypothetical protein
MSLSLKIVAENKGSRKGTSKLKTVVENNDNGKALRCHDDRLEGVGESCATAAWMMRMKGVLRGCYASSTMSLVGRQNVNRGSYAGYVKPGPV